MTTAPATPKAMANTWVRKQLEPTALSTLRSKTRL